MRLGAAGESIQLKPNVLVLGSSIISDRIAFDLENEEFEVYRESSFSIPVADYADPDSLLRLEDLLRAFETRVRTTVGSSPLCVHPGDTPWSNGPELVTTGARLGIAVIAPSARVLSLFANRLNCLAQAERQGIPHLIVHHEPLHSVREIERLRTGFPMILKSVRSWSGAVGVRVFHDLVEVRRDFPLWQEQLFRYTGEALVYAEEYLTGARRISIPFVRFSNGETRIFPFVDSSLQGRGRKFIEICPALPLDPAAIDSLQAFTLKWLDFCSYVGVGVLEYLVDGPKVHLIEALPRLNTGYRVWETAARTKAVQWQLAAMGALQGKVLVQQVENAPQVLGVRLYAENSILQIPQPGIVHEVATVPSFECGIKKGSNVPWNSSGLLGTLMVEGPQWTDVVNRAAQDLKALWISGSLQTNEAFVLELLENAMVREGVFHADFIDEEFVPSAVLPAESLRIAVDVCAGLSRASPEEHWSVGHHVLCASGVPLRWLRGPNHFIHEGQPGISGVIGIEAGGSARVTAFPLGSGRWQVRIGNHFAVVQRSTAILPSELRGTQRRLLFSQVLGRVHSILYQEGSLVPAHEPILVIESLHMLVAHRLPVPARVLSWKIRAENEVRVGDILAEFERVENNAKPVED